MFVVVDFENGQAFGPYDTREEAEADIILAANKNGWREVIEAGDHPFDDGNSGLTLILLTPPEGHN